MAHHLAAILMLTSGLPPAAALAGQPAEAAGAGYRLEVALFDGERAVGRPTLTLREGQPATITVDRDGGYSLRVVARPDPMRRNSVLVATAVRLRRGDAWTTVASPSLSLQLGGSGSVELAGANPFRMEISVAASGTAPR